MCSSGVVKQNKLYFTLHVIPDSYVGFCVVLFVLNVGMSADIQVRCAIIYSYMASDIW